MNFRKNSTSILLSVMLAAGFAAELSAASGITNLIVRQRWPWSQVVDIDFVLTGTNTTAVRFYGQYDGRGRFELLDKDLDKNGAVGGFTPGPHHVTWDPVKAGLGEVKRTGFSIAAEIGTYLVLNLSDGSYQYRAEPPEGGWLANSEYSRTKMVFRWIPAGTKLIGLNDDLYARLGFTAAYAHQRSVTMSSDYYLAVYPTTKGQHDFVVSQKDVSTYKATFINVAYNDLRGAVADGINWPETMYAVKANSVVDKYRSVVAETFPSAWKIDLPTACQWEYAFRATTPDDWLWSVGGTATDDDIVFTNCLNKIATWSGNSSANPDHLVGQHDPNGWGLYDMAGLCCEWNLDWCRSHTSYYKGVDPVGPESADDNTRTRRSIPYTYGTFQYFSSAYMNKKAPTEAYGYRLCIHLKPIER